MTVTLDKGECHAAFDYAASEDSSGRDRSGFMSVSPTVKTGWIIAVVLGHRRCDRGLSGVGAELQFHHIESRFRHRQSRRQRAVHLDRDLLGKLHRHRQYDGSHLPEHRCRLGRIDQRQPALSAERGDAAQFQSVSGRLLHLGMGLQPVGLRRDPIRRPRSMSRSTAAAAAAPRRRSTVRCGPASRRCRRGCTPRRFPGPRHRSPMRIRRSEPARPSAAAMPPRRRSP